MHKPVVVGFLAFALFGMLTGTLIGWTSESVVAGFLPVLFAFGGGSVIGFLSKVEKTVRQDALLGLMALSFGALLGLYSSVLVVEHQLLTPERFQRVPTNQSGDQELARKYLRENVLSDIEAIDQTVRAGLRSKSDAYDMLLETLRDPDK